MSTAILPTAYLPPIQYFQKLKNYDHCLIEYFEHFPKQTYRNRTDIYSPNGRLTLSVPLIKRGQRQTVKDIRISYDSDWQKLHWRSLESCYRRSPFFEYYEDDLAPFYHDKKFDYLADLNTEMLSVLLELLKLKTSYSFTERYEKQYPESIDFRELIDPKVPPSADPEFQPQPYMQVFGSRHGFLPNLSIVDLLFNEGSKAPDFL
ncbi:MAG: WbqC family protein [Bacteroidia bacterium]